MKRIAEKSHVDMGRMGAQKVERLLNKFNLFRLKRNTTKSSQLLVFKATHDIHLKTRYVHPICTKKFKYAIRKKLKKYNKS